MHMRDLLVYQNFRHPTSWGIDAKKSLDLGCGHRPRNPFGAKTLFGADLIDEEEFSSDSARFLNEVQHVQFKYKRVERNARLPFSDSSFDVVTAFDFLEHLSREPVARLGTNEFIFLMNEVSRLLKRGGIFLAVTPAFPSPAAFQDPTHTNIISEKTIEYFVGDNPAAHSNGYGFEGNLCLIRQFWLMPFNKILGVNANSENYLSRFNVKVLRRYIANIRKPTHLVWLLKKN